MFQDGILRSLSLPIQVSTMIRRLPVSMTSAWMLMIRRPASVAKCGTIQRSGCTASGVACGRIKRVPPIASTSMLRVILTSPICYLFIVRPPLFILVGHSITAPWRRTRSSTRPAVSYPRSINARCRRQPAEQTENDCDRGEMSRQEAHQDEDKDRLGPLGQAAEIVKRFMAAKVRRDAVSLGKDRIGEEGRAGSHKAEDKKCGGNGISRIGERKAEHDACVKNKIADDIEIATEIGEPRLAGNRAVEPVAKPVEQDESERGEIIVEGEQWHRREAERKSAKSDRVRRNAERRDSSPCRIEGRINNLPERRI